MIVLFTNLGLHGPYTGQMEAVLHQMSPLRAAHISTGIQLQARSSSLRSTSRSTSQPLGPAA